MAEDIRIFLATDLHYLSHDLTDNGTLFMRSVENGDGKLAEYAPEIFREFTETVLEERPDAVIIPGDLTYNGEKTSLLEVLEGLDEIKKAGIPVLILPGNHDINYPYAFRYKGESAFRVEKISQEIFTQLGEDYGYGKAVSSCIASFSYLWKFSDDWYALFLDANTEKDPGKLGAETMLWAKEQLDYVKERGARTVIVSHHNILRHNKFMYKGFVIDNEEELGALLEDYDIAAAFSGHCHLQNKVSNERFTDYATGSLTVYPLQYAEILLKTDKTLTYSGRKLKKLQREARKRFDSVVIRQIEKTLTETKINPIAKKRMLTFAVGASEKYFSGGKVELSDTDEGWNAWKKYASKNFWYYYFQSISE